MPLKYLSVARSGARLIIAPNGVAYAPPEARPGILPRLLQEILSTRIMVKAAMKRAPKSAKVQSLGISAYLLAGNVLSGLSPAVCFERPKV